MQRTYRTRAHRALLIGVVPILLMASYRIGAREAGASDVNEMRQLKLVDEAGRPYLVIEPDSGGVALRFGEDLAGSLRLVATDRDCSTTLLHGGGEAAAVLRVGEGRAVVAAQCAEGDSSLYASTDRAVVAAKDDDSTSMLGVGSGTAAVSVSGSSEQKGGVRISSTPESSNVRVSSPSDGTGISAQATSDGSMISLFDPASTQPGEHRARDVERTGIVTISAGGACGSILLQDAAGVPRVGMVDTGTVSSLGVFQGGGAPAVGIIGGQDGGQITLCDHDGERALELGARKGSGLLQIRQASGNRAVSIYAGRRGGLLNIHDEQGRVALAMESASEGGRCIVRNPVQGGVAVLEATKIAGQVRVVDPNGAHLALVGASENGAGGHVYVGSQSQEQSVRLEATSERTGILVRDGTSSAFLPKDE